MARVKVVKVDGEPEYHELFMSCSSVFLWRLPSTQRVFPETAQMTEQKLMAVFRPPYSNLNELIKDKPRQVKRKARKAVGLPASEDGAVLAAMLKSLQDAVEDHLGHGTTAIPHLLALYKEDILDAFEYLDLQFIDLPFRDKPLRETSAAYAGYGLGLCSNYTDLITCKRELDNWPQKVVMAVLYTQSALTVSLSITKSAYSLFEPQYRHLEDFILGYGARHDYLSQDYY